MDADTKDMNREKSAKEASTEGKATAEGDLATIVKKLKEAEAASNTANTDCMTTSADCKSTVAARIKRAQGDLQCHGSSELERHNQRSSNQTYSFLQTAASSQLRTRADLANSEVITLVKKLAHDHHSAALAQLASRMAVVVRYGSKNGDNVV